MEKTHLFPAALKNLFACVNIERINNSGFIELPIKTENVMEEKQRNKKRRCFRDEKEDMSPREIQPFTCLPRFRVLLLSKLRPNPQEAIKSDYKWLTVQRFQVFVCAYIIHLKTKGTVIGIVISHWLYLLYELHSHLVSYNLEKKRELSSVTCIWFSYVPHTI